MMKQLLSRWLFIIVFLAPLLSLGQAITVRGKVTAARGGETIPGASVQIRGTSRGTVTNQNGNFEIQASIGEKILVSFIGFQSRELSVSGPTLNISLGANDKVLNEVVVTALGISRSRNSLPYSAQQISGAETNKAAVSTNFVSNLSGKVAGLQITQSNALGGSTNAILRGFKSLTQSNQALFVVDGVPFDNTNLSVKGYDLGNAASDINPDDIASVSVLKGAAASALYGSRASNGVILITTKKGSRHPNGLGVSVNLGIQVGRVDNSTLPTYQTTYGQGYGSSAVPATPPADNPNGFFYYTPVFNSNGQPVNVVQTNNDAATGPAYDPNLNVYNWDAFAPGNPNYGKPRPWVPAANHNPTSFLINPVSKTAGMVIDGGGDNGTFKLGYTRDNSTDFMPNSSLVKNLVNFSSTYDLNKHFSAGGSANYSDESAIGRYGYQYNGATNPIGDFRQWRPTNVDISEEKSEYFRTGKNITWNWQPKSYTANTNLGTILRPAYHDNLYWDRYQNYEADTRNRYFGNIFLNYKINSFINLRGAVSLDSYNQLAETRVNVGSQAPSNYSRFDRSFSETNYDLLATFNKTFGDFNTKALLGSNIRKDLTQRIEATTNGGLVVPSFYALANSVKTPNAPLEVYGKKEVDGVFAGATITYRDMLTLDATMRRDQSSTLPKGRNAYYYPSISGNFVFSRLLPSATWLSYGKLLANYAEVGGDAPLYSTQNVFINTPNFNGQTLFGAPFSNNNANLRPERQKSYEFGLESQFLENRLGFNVTYFKTKQEDQITPIVVSSATGFSQFYVNGGSVQNSGIEVSFNATPLKSPDFSWNIMVNWSKYTSKVLSLYNNQPSYTIASLQNSIQLVAEVGKQYGVIRGTDYVYLNGQREIDATGHYIISPNKLTDIGNINPEWFGGITNTFRFRSFSLSFLVDVRKGGQVYSLDLDYGASSGLYPFTAGNNDLGNPVRSPLSSNNKSGGIILKGVTADGKQNNKRIDESDINSGNYSFSSAYGEADKQYVYDASFVKLREASLSYSVPKSIVDQIKFIKGIDFAITGRNLWIIHKNLPYADPEQGQAAGGASGSNSGSANASIGFQNASFPVYRMFGANLKLRF